MHTTERLAGFSTRRDAALSLAARLDFLAGRDDVTVLAVRRMSLPIAFEISRALDVRLDLFSTCEMGTIRIPLQGGDRSPALASRIVILVDDEVRTGGAMKAAIQAVRECHPALVVVAAPLASREACKRMREIVDSCICAKHPGSLAVITTGYPESEEASEGDVESMIACTRPAPPPVRYGSPGAQPQTQE